MSHNDPITNIPGDAMSVNDDNALNSEHWVGAMPPYRVDYIDPTICATSTPQWFVMGTVDGDPRNPQGPVAICEYEPSAHAIAYLLNATVNGHVVVYRPGQPTPKEASDG